MMKKLSGAAAVLAALMMLFVAGCEQSSGGGETPASGGLLDGQWKATEFSNQMLAGFVTEPASFTDGRWEIPGLATGSYNVDEVGVGKTFTGTIETVLDTPAAAMGVSKASITMNSETELVIAIDLSNVPDMGSMLKIATITFTKQ